MEGSLRRSARYSQESNYEEEEEDDEEDEDEEDDEEEDEDYEFGELDDEDSSEEDSYSKAARTRLRQVIEEKRNYLERLRSELTNLKKDPFVIPEESEEEKEARILNRVQQLKKDSLWFTFEPKKKIDPSLKKPKVHWDFVLEEMSWLSSIIQQETKAKKLGAKKCAKMVQKHFSDKALSVTRAEKAHEQHLKKLASFQAKEIREFWNNVEKFFEFRLQKRIEYMRKKALDEHLNFIVDKTEKYSNMLAESLAQDISSQTKDPSPGESGVPSGKVEKEYRPDSSSEDDEETMAMDEENHDQDEEEVNKLQKESEIPIEELLRQYYPMSDSESVLSEKEDIKDIEDTKTEEVEPQEEIKEDETEKEVGKEEVDKDEEYTLERLMNEEDSDSDFNNVIEMAAKFQPTGNTLATTNVKTPIPFILKHNLREYQHIGLDWLVTLQERKLNGILADEMGLGKTIQTIAFLAHMACEKQMWGPHLIVVPTSVMLNWEMEIKKWAPAFKVLTYYGSQKERRIKRIGWTKPNAFHICITSYKLVIQDHSSFRRKKWHYFILDEAQHIKNFKSQRWQMLLNFVSDGRLLLTGTPLQNNLMELWSLMHFLMPHVFESHRDFKEWFSNPLTGMVEGSAEYNDGLIKRLHKVLRPFLLRRLKNEVEKQLPKKYEHVIRCGLSKRQRYLYDDFMSRTKTKETLETGNFLSVINILMQLRKVCNHPNLFEPRPTVSPFVDVALDFRMPKRVLRDRIRNLSVDLAYHPILLTPHEFTSSAYTSFRTNQLKLMKLHYPVETVSVPVAKLHLSIKNDPQSLPLQNLSYIKADPILNNNIWFQNYDKDNELTVKIKRGSYSVHPYETPQKVQRIELEDPIFDYESSLKTNGDFYVEEVDFPTSKRGIFSSSMFDSSLDFPPLQTLKEKIFNDFEDHNNFRSQLNRLKCEACPVYGSDLIESLSFISYPRCSFPRVSMTAPGDHERLVHKYSTFPENVNDIQKRLKPFFDYFMLYIPHCLSIKSLNHTSDTLMHEKELQSQLSSSQTLSVFPSFNLLLPETRLIQYDCGKLQMLQKILSQLKADGSRVLIFTQMTRILDILEIFLNYHGYIYLRLDGSTKVEQRQILMERFNGSNKYFCFILSTRSGGVGINLTGANSVIFYDSDWNPTMDAQAQDRCHRIGQTRDVHIYRLVSEKTIEENILKKANQKRLLGDLAIEGGSFTTATLKKQTIRDLFDVNTDNVSVAQNAEDDHTPPKVSARAVGVFENAISAVEDDTDIQALKSANKEVAEDQAEFDETENAEKNEMEELIKSILDQLTPLERYALSHIEQMEKEWEDEQISQAEAEIEEQKRELNSKKIEELSEDSTDEEDE